MKPKPREEGLVLMMWEKKADGELNLLTTYSPLTSPWDSRWTFLQEHPTALTLMFCQRKTKWLTARDHSHAGHEALSGYKCLNDLQGKKQFYQQQNFQKPID